MCRDLRNSEDVCGLRITGENRFEYRSRERNKFTEPATSVPRQYGCCLGG